MFICDLIWFFKYLVKINIKEKKEKSLLKQLKEVVWTVSGVRGGWSDSFIIQGGKTDLARSWGTQKKIFFSFWSSFCWYFHASVLALKQYIISPLEMTSNIMLIWAVFLWAANSSQEGIDGWIIFHRCTMSIPPPCAWGQICIIEVKNGARFLFSALGN